MDIFEDETGLVWIGVHFGSRGLGHKTATYFLKAAGAADGMDVDPGVIDAAGDLGADYLACMELATDMPMPGAIGSAGASPRFWAQPSPKKFTTTTTLPGARHTAVRIFGWSARALHRLSPASADSWAAPWAKSP